MEHIIPVEVIRDEYGMFYHPQLPETDDEFILKSWFEDRNLEFTTVWFESDAPTNKVDSWFENGECDCSWWSPSKPAGDGWFVFGIWDTEDGPVCVWVRDN